MPQDICLHVLYIKTMCSGPLVINHQVSSTLLVMYTINEEVVQWT